MARRAIEILVGSVVVYVAMAACGGLVEPVGATDPPPTAFAPNRVEEQCTHVMLLDGTSEWLYAEHEYPGRSAEALAGVEALTRFSAEDHPAHLTRPQGYTHMQASQTIFVRDGAVAVMCGQRAYPGVDRVTFFAPF